MPAATVAEPVTVSSAAGAAEQSGAHVNEQRGDVATFMTCHAPLCACFFTCHTGYPYAPSLVSPANAATVASTPTLTGTYTHSMGTRGDLHFQLCSDSTCSAVLQTGIDTNVNSGSNGTWTPTTLTSGTYYWRARGYDGSLYGSYSAIRSFTIGGAATPPTNTALPAISGTTTELQTLTASTGTWSGTTPMTYGYQWQTCNSSGASCTNIGGATSSTYVLDRTDVSMTVRVVVTATNSAGSASATSAASAVIVAAGAEYVDSPGSATSKTNGTSLGIVTGFKAPASRLLVAVLTNDTAATVTSITDSRGNTWYPDHTTINGTTVRTSVWSTYSKRALPAGSTVTATWSGTTGLRTFVIHQFTGTTRSVNATGGTVGASVSPTAAATTTTARALLVGAMGINGPSSETWTATAPFSFIGIIGTSGGGSNQSSVSQRASVTTTGSYTSTGTLGSSRTWSSVLVAYAAVNTATLPPANLTLPTISGTPSVGSTLTASTGTWSNSPTGYTYEWERCDSSGASCVGISGATSSTYTVQVADVGSTLRVVVTAENAGGSTSAISVQTAVVAAPPSNTAVPVVSGTTTESSTLSTTDGTWANSPTAFAYQWRRCDSSGAACVDIVGATSSTYVLQVADIGSTIRSQVTATNAAGSAVATSTQTAVVSGRLPSNSVLPSISGTVQELGSVAVANGTWSGTNPITFAHQWRRCDSAGAACVDIAGASASTYVPQRIDVGSTLRVVVTATNACSTGCGSVAATSAATAVVAPASGLYVDSPAQAGASTTGTTLTLTTTTAISADRLVVLAAVSDTGGALVSVVDSQGNAWFADRAQANGTATAGNVWSSYIVRPLAVGSTITITWSASSADRAAGIYQFAGVRGRTLDVTGSATGSSTAPSSSATTTSPVDIVFGAQATNGPLTDSYAATAPMVAAPAAGTTGGGGNVAVFSQHRRTTATGAYTASGTLGASRAWASIITAYVAGDGTTSPPASTTPPSISGTATVGSTLTTSNGTWSGSPSSYQYQWLRCDAAGATCLTIQGATTSTYVLDAADLGSTIRAVVIAVNAGGSASATTAQTAVVAAAPSISLATAGYGADGSGPYSSPTSAPIGAASPTETKTAEVRVTVTTPNPNGYAIWARDGDGGGALTDTVNSSLHMPWVPSGNVATPVAWSGAGVGISMFGSAAAPAKWCSGGQANCTTPTDVDLQWAALTGVDEQLGSSGSAAPGGETARVPVRMTVPSLQAAGSYSGNLVFTAIALP